VNLEALIPSSWIQTAREVCRFHSHRSAAHRRVEAYPGRAFAGVVYALDPRSMKRPARESPGAPANDPLLLRPGMFAKIRMG